MPAMIDLFAPEVRRNPWPVYDRLRAESPVLHVPPTFNGWMVFDYESVKWIMTDHASFSSRILAPDFSFIFTDPPDHIRLRNLFSCAFTPRVIADLEPTIREISKELLDTAMAAGRMEFSSEFSAPLAMRVIAGMMGIAPEDWPRYKGWNAKILGLPLTRSGGESHRAGTMGPDPPAESPPPGRNRWRPFNARRNPRVFAPAYVRRARDHH